MKYRIIKLIGILSMSLMILVGCSGGQAEQVTQLQQQLESLQEQNKQFQETIVTLQQEVVALNTANKTLLLEVEELTKESYTIYTRDADSWEIVEVKDINIDKTLSLQEKMQELARGLSSELFLGLPIQVVEIKKINGDDIAVIDLQESKDGLQDENKSWMDNYFQGSTGGTITATALEETFLQKDSDMNWVDGVQFLYNGKQIENDHVTLNNIVYR